MDVLAGPVAIGLSFPIFSMKSVIGVVCFVLVVLLVTVNATVMIISPRLWFKVPDAIRLSGSLSKRNFSNGWGALQIRLLGVCLLALMAWFLYTALSH